MSGSRADTSSASASTRFVSWDRRHRGTRRWRWVWENSAKALQSPGGRPRLLNRLDGFNPGPVEIWAPRASRNRCVDKLARTNNQPLRPGDVVSIDGLRCLSAEPLILDSLLFRFTPTEIHNAIDSAIRMRLVDEKRLRRRIVDDLVINANHRRVLIESLVDTGG